LKERRVCGSPARARTSAWCSAGRSRGHTQDLSDGIEQQEAQPIRSGGANSSSRPPRLSKPLPPCRGSGLGYRRATAAECCRHGPPGCLVRISQICPPPGRGVPPRQTVPRIMTTRLSGFCRIFRDYPFSGRGRGSSGLPAGTNDSRAQARGWQGGRRR
jgi:hypothetical protein